eukprot:6197886-Pleurochrysis_carterae.AAC.2
MYASAELRRRPEVTPSARTTCQLSSRPNERNDETCRYKTSARHTALRNDVATFIQPQTTGSQRQRTWATGAALYTAPNVPMSLAACCAPPPRRPPAGTASAQLPRRCERARRRASPARPRRRRPPRTCTPPPRLPRAVVAAAAWCRAARPTAAGRAPSRTSGP